MAPPLTLTFSGSAPVSFSQASTTGANASLISTRSMSSMDMPAFFSAYAVAGMGADSIRMGSSPRTERWWIRARGVSPCSRTARSDASSMADAPSETWDETPAVSRPPSTTGFSPAIFSSEVSRRGPSSVVTSP
ncbi:hypothetical protein ABZY02_35745 [Streptomyces sp. NPDC006649]|uniref:hypothetical protein n=1 Tax=Streptomyces sp. NPDC006649 TaxID=3156896 RepID=UPI0033A96895